MATAAQSRSPGRPRRRPAPLPPSAVARRAARAFAHARGQAIDLAHEQGWARGWLESVPATQHGYHVVAATGLRTVLAAYDVYPRRPFAGQPGFLELTKVVLCNIAADGRLQLGLARGER